MTDKGLAKRLIEMIESESDLNKTQIKELLKEFKSYPPEILTKIENGDFSYSELHTHTQYSLLDGVNDVSSYIEEASRLNHEGLAITDHRVTYGWYKMRQAHQHGLKPIYGCEVEVDEDNENYHLVLLAKNNIGYKNILKIVSWSHMENVKSKPCVPKEIIKKHSEGVIALSACLGGILAKRIIDKKRPYEEVKKEAEWWKNEFPGRFYVEIQNYEYPKNANPDLTVEQQDFIENQNIANKVLVKLANSLDLPLIATNDVHYSQAGQNVVQDILICISRQTNLKDPNRWRFLSKLHHMKDKWEMLWRFRKNPEAVINTSEIVSQCNVSYQEDYLLPEYPFLPEGISQQDFLKTKVKQGLKDFYSLEENYKPLLKKFNISKKELWNKILARAEMELSVLFDMHFDGYMLLVSLCVDLAKELGILVGPGRGSAAGSIVSLSLGITEVCPLRYDLIFERFLNPDRNEMPDIDVDFHDERRPELMEEFAKKIGEDRVAQISTFGRLQARAAIRFVGKTLGDNLDLSDKLAKMVPFGADLKEAMELSEMKEMMNKNSIAKEILKYALLVEGKTKHHGTHAAGVLVSSEPIQNHVAVQRTKKAKLPVAQTEMDDVDGLRLIKQDFLGLKTLSVISDTVDLIRERQGITLDPYKIPVNDKKTYEMLARGEGVACFQLESKGMRELMKDIHVECFEDIVDCIALYRPGVLSVNMHVTYSQNKQNPDDIDYPHESLKEILNPTYGVLVYQEQAMQIANKMAGFSMSDGDVLRKAIGKKKIKLMDKMKKQFIEGSMKNGVTKEQAEEVWHLIEVMAGYSFNKSHSVAYGYISARTAYLKAHFPKEYMLAAISRASLSKSDKAPLYIEEARRMGIEVRKPDVNKSETEYSIKDGAIIVGLSGIKGLGKASQVIIDERNDNGDYKDIVDFQKRCPSVNKTGVEGLIRTGAFDSLGLHRRKLLAKIDEILAIKPKKNNMPKNQLFLPLGDIKASAEDLIRFPDIEDFEEIEIAKLEYEYLGTYITSHPYSYYKDMAEQKTTYSLDEMQEAEEEKLVIVSGLVKELKTFFTKKRNEEMAVLELDDMSGTIKVVIFPRTYKDYKYSLNEFDVVMIKGRTDYNERFGYQDDEDDQAAYDVQIIADEVIVCNKEMKAEEEKNLPEGISMTSYLAGRELVVIR